MGIQEAPYSLRLDHEVMQKIRVLAAKERRSINMQLCIAVESYLEQYEKEHGEIPLPDKD
ncbi:hypothetical protein [uncultured Flavonifractor sp.]|uniref:hypothetical protein n=1 Tax=uncultured Flavonifractor sp. TaxID=1193534 RepID=UPI00260A2F8F|nr:hypothetical protein [uncultured Flavonifractor sp.]